MAIASQVFASTEHSPAARKRNVSLGEFLLTLFVVAAATLLGVAGGIWLAERDQSASRRETSSPSTSMQPVSQQPGAPSEPRTADSSNSLVPTAAARESEIETVSLGLPSVPALRHSYRADYTEIAIELRAAVLLRAAQLHNPERVYFDLSDGGRAQKPKGRLQSRREVQVSDDRVSGVRVVRWQSGSVRVVVDLKRPCKYSYRLTSDAPSRLILGLWTQPPGAAAGRGPLRQGAAGGSEQFAAKRP
jgi:AMIN domain